MFTPREAELERGWPGRIDGERVIQLAAQTLEAFFTGGGTAREHAEYPLAHVDFRPPVIRPRSLRLFSAFEQSDVPYFSYGDPVSIAGPEDDLPYPDGTSELDVGLGIAAVIGADGAIGGFTVMNDWTARDLERREREFGAGPSKSRDFATAIGPVVVTTDEFSGAEGEIVARVNGVERARTSLGDLAHTWDAIAAHAARNTLLKPGDLVGAVAPPGERAWLERGDLVELEVGGVGVLRNRVV
jgi:2-keto-4-pentenoate hydratase/2-oxohepta-3-ene-1,7-dioic acid hydratase in catechol pathway